MSVAACLPGSGGESPIGDLLALTDCRAAALGAGGYQAIGDGGWFAAVLTGLLTVAVALQGYRLLVGRVPDLDAGLSMIVRIGMAIALASSTAAYGTLVYRVATEGPFEVSARLTGAAGLATGDLPGRLDRLYTAIRLDPETRGRLASGGNAVAMRTPAMTGDAAQRTAATALVVVSAGPWIAVRLTMAFLLALGPLAATLLLFDATLGLFRNWLRAVAGGALSLTGLAVAIPLELEALEPIVARAGVGTPDYIAIAAVLGVFALLSGGILFAAARVTAVVPLAPSRSPTKAGDDRAPVAAVMPFGPPPTTVIAAPAQHAAAPPSLQRSHAASVTNALAAAARRSSPATVTIDQGHTGTASRRISVPSRAPLPALALAGTGAASAHRSMPTLRSPSNRSSRR